MGRITNALGLRLSQKRNWKINSVLQNSESLNIKFLGISEFLNSLFLKEKITLFHFLYGGYRLNVQSNKTFLNIFLYDSSGITNTGSYGNKEKKSSSLLRLLYIERDILLFVNKYGYLNNFFVKFHIINKHDLTAELVIFYIVLKLKQDFSLGAIMGPLSSFLQKQEFLNGYRIDCSGRFTKKQRASFFSFKSGIIGFSSLKNNIDYSEGSSILKYGKCGVKVWLNKK